MLMMSVSVVLLAVLYLIAFVELTLLQWEVESVPLIIASRFIKLFESVDRTYRPRPPKQCPTLLSLNSELLTALEILIVECPAVLLLIRV